MLSRNIIEIRRAVIGLLSAAVLFALFACSDGDGRAATERSVNVQTASAELREHRPYLSATGTLNPFEEALVSSEIDGIIRTVRADEGSPVAKGAVLAQIDDIDYSLDMKRSEAALNQAVATLKNTQIEYQRKETLFKEQLVTQQQFDDVVTRKALAEAEVERAKATLGISRQKYARTRIVAPFAGVVKEKKISAGDLVKNGSPAFSVIQTHTLKLNFSIPEKEVGKLQQGQEVSVKVDAYPDREFKGKINIVAPSLDEKTRTLKLEALIPNADGTLKPGLFARVQHYTGASRSMVVMPIVALLYEGDQIRAFVVEGNRARERKVKVGNKYGEFIEITEGLKEGDQVVVLGQQNLVDNTLVKIQSASPQETKQKQ